MIGECLKNKIEFVSGLNKAVANQVGAIESIDYAVCENLIHGYMDEYLVVNYRGGAIQARNCSCNSNAAILEELAKMVYSSQVYCRDTETYKLFVKNAGESPNCMVIYNSKNL